MTGVQTCALPIYDAKVSGDAEVFGNAAWITGDAEVSGNKVING